MLISIIIPVYNAEKYLSKCLDSVKNQTYQDIEIILVNDGSTDQSRLICEEYSKKDNRFIVINKENGGVSSARNSGLKVATGKYIGFVDPDDWIEKNMYERLYNLIIENSADISMCGYIKEYVDGSILYNTKKSDIIRLNQKQALNSILNEEGFKGYLWNKLFSASLIKKDPKIIFDEEIHFCEDLLFCCKSILKSTNIVFDPTPYYHYIIHKRNASQSQFSIKKLTALDALGKIINLLNNIEGVSINNFINLYMHINISLLMNGIHEKKISRIILRDLKRNLYKFNLSNLKDRTVKISLTLGKIHVFLLYFVWRILNKSSNSNS